MFPFVPLKKFRGGKVFLLLKNRLFGNNLYINSKLSFITTVRQNIN